MAIPTQVGVTNFMTGFGAESGIVTHSAAANRRLIGLSISSSSLGALPEFAGYMWGEVRNAAAAFVRFETLPVMTGSEVGIFLPIEFSELTWRAIFIPAEKFPSRSATWRFYTI